MKFWCISRSGSPDRYLWLMDPDLAPDPDPKPDLTPFFNNFKDVKKIFIFFSYKIIIGTVAFLWNFFISREAATAERR